MFKKIERFYYKNYLVNHLNKTNRLLHFMANLLIVFSVIGYMWVGCGWIMLGIAVGGYSLALIGHVFFEGNLPVIVGHPLMAVFGDVWMFFRMATGRMSYDLSIYKDYQ